MAGAEVGVWRMSLFEVRIEVLSRDGVASAWAETARRKPDKEPTA